MEISRTVNPMQIDIAKLRDPMSRAEIFSSIPERPGVYTFSDASGKAIYIGMSANLRRRMSDYFLTSQPSPVPRARRHRSRKKPLLIAKSAATLAWEELPNSSAARRREMALIAKHKPEHNIDGAYTFLYPYFCLKAQDAPTICTVSITTDLQPFEGFTIFGPFRGLREAKGAYFALVALLSKMGHETPTDLPKSRFWVARKVRNLPVPLFGHLENFLGGEGDEFLPWIATALLENPDARSSAKDLTKHLRLLRAFYKETIQPFQTAVARWSAAHSLHPPKRFVPQDARDLVMTQFQTADEWSPSRT